MIIYQTILILTKLFAIWSWITSIRSFFIAIICFAWFGITFKLFIETQNLVQNWFKQLIKWIDWSIRDDSKNWFRSKKQICVNKQTFKRYVIDELNFIIAFKYRNSSFYIEQKNNRFTTNIRKSNASWNNSSKHENKRSKSRFKQNTTSSLRWKIFKRNSKKMQNRLIKLFSFSNRSSPVPEIGGNFGVWRIWRSLHTQQTHNDCKQYITYVNVRDRYCSFAAMKFNMCYMLKLQIAHRTMNVKTWNFHTWCILTLIFWLSIFFYIKFKTDVVYIKCIEHIQRSYVMMLTCKIFWTSKYFATSHMKITWFDYMMRDLIFSM